ncbi:MAG: FecR domain-containing protein [Deltaproteobacteria bacterium]|nr:FecR domain-containing protein [Deltaproteobacteria bacterium]
MNKKQTIINLVSVGILIFTWQGQLHSASSIGKAIELFGKKEELKYTRQTQTESLAVNTPLYYNDGILTGSNSSTRVLVEDPASQMKAAFYVFEDSKFTLDKEVVEASGKKVTVKHTQGALSVFVKGLKKGDEIQIVTPQATLGVRGTGLYLKLTKDRLFLTIAMGVVLLHGKALLPGKMFEIESGNIVKTEAASKEIPQLDENMRLVGIVPGAYKNVLWSPANRNDTADERRDIAEIDPTGL